MTKNDPNLRVSFTCAHFAHLWLKIHKKKLNPTFQISKKKSQEKKPNFHKRNPNSLELAKKNLLTSKNHEKKIHNNFHQLTTANQSLANSSCAKCSHVKLTRKMGYILIEEEVTLTICCEATFAWSVSPTSDFLRCFFQALFSSKWPMIQSGF